jgi:sec-independent protein translocase protein TatB
MPSFGDSAFIFILALLLFGPKKLPELARQLGKLMAEFRRASNEFRMQMDEELRLADQAEQQKKIAAMEAAAPVTPPIEDSTPDPAHFDNQSPSTLVGDTATETPTPLPIASEGELSIMPPSTGLPTPRSFDAATETVEGNAALSPVLEHIPHTQEPVSQDSTSTTPDSSNYTYTPTPPDHHADAGSTESTPAEAHIHG